MAQVREVQPWEAPEDERSPWIEELIVRNFKSLAGDEPFRIAVRPLTLLAGANSSGKSSAVQPLLLLKQTLESAFDPGALLLGGPHLEFTSTQQMLPRGSSSLPEAMEIGAKLHAQQEIVSIFQSLDEKSFDVTSTDWGSGKATIPMESDSVGARKRRCFIELVSEEESLDRWSELARTKTFRWMVNRAFAIKALEGELLRIIHVRGLRGRPQRTYPKTAVGNRFPGPFEPYVASVLQSWQEEDPEKLKELGRQLETLGLTWKVQVRQPNASELEVAVGRLPHARRGGAHDLVNIADVGFGVSQTLPVLVALLAAEPGQLVFLEQPEIHLHPKAQVALAEILADAARRKVRVIAETHSILLLTAVQALVAEGRLPTDDVLLHWFERNDQGITEITTRELDEEGRYGDWPEDFADTEMAVQSRYLEAVERKLRAAGGGK